MSNNKEINILDNNNEIEADKLTFNRNLSYSDLFFTGFGFIVGAGIFSLMPYIIKQGKQHSWLSFVIGGVICLITGLSYSKLNLLYPSNDAEYSWIVNILNFDKNRDPEKTYTIVKYLANIIIWIVVIIGLLNSATVLVGQADFIRQYTDFGKHKIIAIMLAIPTIIVMLGNKYATSINKTIMTLVLATFGLLMGQALTKGKPHEIDFNPKTSNFTSMVKSSFITIFAYNGFQSIVQLSEEAKNKSDVPKAIVSSTSFATLVYALITISIISLIGIKKAQGAISPLADAYGVYFGKRGIDVVNFLAIVALSNTMLILTLSRSRLLQKLSVRGIAPGFLKNLTSIRKLIGLKPKENFDNKENELNVNKGKTIPINAIITLSVLTFMLTFLRKGAVDYLAALTSSFIFIVFTLVNSLALIHYFKKKTPEEQKHVEQVDKENPILKGFPWYSVLGLIIAIYNLKLSSKYLRLIA
jgi:basic amino acid/polyamine antiporter, APA family